MNRQHLFTYAVIIALVLAGFVFCGAALHLLGMMAGAQSGY